ncbi:hypothetical protein K7432_003846 [Basidiobolus ranarum]|uniref:F-box domain-containing protein n=1 Tax=Basidiobolus ranarum TaxID=34480 RepID=A0ABR2WZ92_9FUNG
MTLPQLSTEILTLIVSHFTLDKHTLHSLLTVNKLFFKVSAPILYKNPFRPSLWPNETVVRAREILYLLFASANLLPELTEITTEILDWGLTEWEPPTAPFTTNYLDYYTDIDYFQWENAYDSTFFYILQHSSDDFGFGHIIHFLFCKYNAEKIKTIYIPILDVKPYLPIVKRLSSLRRIEFRRVHTDECACAREQGIVTLRDAIEFVKTHVETYSDTLAELKFPDLTDMKSEGVPSDVKIEDIVHILKRPQVIEVDDSYRFCRYLQPYSTEHLQVFSGPFICYDGRIQNWDSASFFKRCPKLEKIRFSSFRSDSFKWAVERRASLTASRPESISSVDNELPPLQDVEMLCMKLAILLIVQDIIDAFRNTIRSITVKDGKPIEHDPEPLGWDWLLPNLVKIDITEADFSLFDYESLNLCPSLKELSLIGKYEYRRRSTVTRFGPILKLPKLRKIHLEFGISYKFNFNSLQYSPLLESLTLCEVGSSLPIRSADSPCWTWNWNMPCLKKIDLTGESAFLFQFGLLDSCPPLECLKLNTGEYHRSLSMDEIPRIDSPLLSESVSLVGPRNVFSGKSTFELCGEWELSEKALTALLQRYMLHVTHIDLGDTEGLTALEVINATKNLPHVIDVSSTLCLTDDDIEQTGMDMTDFFQYGIGTIGSVDYRMDW